MKKQAGIKKPPRSLGSLGIDKRTAVYHAVATWRNEIITDLGGPEALSGQQRMILDEAMRMKIIAHRADTEIASLETIIESGHIIGAVKDRQALATALTRSMVLLGLKKWKQPPPTLAEVLATWGRKESAHGAGVIEGESTRVEEGDRVPEPDWTSRPRECVIELASAPDAYRRLRMTPGEDSPGARRHRGAPDVRQPSGAEGRALSSAAALLYGTAS